MVQKATKRKQKEVKTGNEMEGLCFQGFRMNSKVRTHLEALSSKQADEKNLNLSPANTLPLH